MKLLPALFLVSLGMLSSFSFAQRGKNGNDTIKTANRIVNEYTTLTANAVAGATSLSVAASGLNTNGRFLASLAAGDLVMIIQMQGATILGQPDVNTPAISDPNDATWGDVTNYNNCGRYEYAQVASVPNASTINIDCGLTYDYTVAGKVQIIRVPRYNTLRLTSPGVLTCQAWNGTTGGVLAVEVLGNTTMTAGSKINTTGTGFRGGALFTTTGRTTTTLYSCASLDVGTNKGEGIAGYTLDYNAFGGRYCRAAPANGGGGGNVWNCGGGGGGNAGNTGTWTGQGNPSTSTASWANAWNLESAGFATSVSSGGGRGGYSFSANNQNATTLGPGTPGFTNAWGGSYRYNLGGLGGRPLDYSTGRIFLGGGGGAGEADDGQGGAGGKGGGIIYFVTYGNITGSGNDSIISDGAAGGSTVVSLTQIGQDAAGGAGAGGTIILKTTGTVSGVAIRANGGKGGTQLSNGALNQAEGPGGGGGGGYIAVSNGSPSQTASGGANGTTQSPHLTEFLPNGATMGGAGLTGQSITTFTIAASDVPICSGNTATLTASLSGTVPGGTTITWYSAQTGGSVLGTGTSYTTPSLTSNTTYYVGTCPGTYRIPVNVTITAGPTASVAGPDQSVCGTTATLAGNTPSAGTGTWTLISGAGAITTPSSPTSGITGLGAGPNVFQWTISLAGCSSSSSQVTITGGATATTAVAGSNQTVCGTTATLAGNTPTTGTGTWTLISGAGTITTPSSPTSGITGLGAGANVFQWSISSGSCPASTSQVTITGTTPPTTSVAGTNQSVCGTTATLAGNTPATGTGTWTLVSGAGSITSPSSPNSGITGLGAGANVFQWSITNGSCPASTSQVTITGTTPPTTASAGSNQTVCGTATLAGNIPTTGTGTWTLISGAGTITTPSSPSSGVTGIGAGANVFQWSITNGSCPASTSQVTITGTTPPTTSVAGSDQTVCGTTATLAGNAPSNGSGTWTLISGAGTVTTPSSPTSGITGLGAGPNVFQWSITNGSCPASTSQVTITGTTPPTTASAGSNQTVCGTATLAGNTPSTGTGTWTLISGAGNITSPSSPTSGVTGIGAGANVFEWSIANGSCPASTSQVTITGMTPPTTSVAGSDQTVCGSTATLAGNTPSSGSGTWTLISGAGNITTPSSPTSGITGLGTGANVFEWSITNGSCPASSSQVTITQTAPPTASVAGSDQTVCAATASLAGNTPSSGSGTWTLISGAGNITTPSSPTSGITGLGVGANVFEWSISNGACPASSSQVTITQTAPPTASVAGSDQTVCGSTATLAGNAPTTGTGTWTLISGAGSITTPSSPSSGITGLGAGANVFEWTIANGVCPASGSQVTITGTAAPTASVAGTDQTICGSTATLSGNTPATGTGAWTKISGVGTITNPSSPVSGVTGLGTGANVFEWTISNSPCPSSSSQVTITVNPAPTTASAGPDQAVCGSTATLAANTPVVGTGLWTLVSGAGTITTPSSPTSGVTGLGTGTNVFQWTISNAPCSPSTSTMSVTSGSALDATIASTTPVCAGSPAFNLSAATPGGTWSGTGITDATNGTFNPLTAGTFTVTYTITGSCGNTDTEVITVLTPLNAVINAVAPVCANSASFNLTATPSGGTWYGTGITNPGSGTFDPAVSGSGTFSIMYGVVGTCSDTATQSILVNTLPTPSASPDVVSGCAPLCVHFTESVSTTCNAISYTFGDGTSSTGSGVSHCYASAGAYSATITCTDANGCSGTSTISPLINVAPVPMANFSVTPPGVITPNTAVTFTDASTNGGNQLWNFGDPGSANNTSFLSADNHIYAAEGTYCVTLVSSNSSACVDSTIQCITVAGDAVVSVPNVFTPNGDNNNDVFSISSSGLKELECSIYDRWGLKVAELDSPNDVWDGRTTSGASAPDGVYFYILNMTGLNDKTTETQGFVQLLSTK